MNDYNVPIIEPTIDYTKVPSINQKRTISFINQFLIHTVTFLNKFAMSCEERLYEFEYKLQRVEAGLKILESRLSSIPGIEKISDPTTNDVVESVEENLEEIVQNIQENNEIEEEIVIKENTIPEEGTNKEQPIRKDPSYEKYFKMMHFGVPKAAVKLKMQQEGLNPSVLDDP